VLKGEVLQPHMEVLDFGCGTGLLALAIADSAASVLGVDNSIGMIDVRWARCGGSAMRLSMQLERSIRGWRCIRTHGDGRRMPADIGSAAHPRFNLQVWACRGCPRQPRVCPDTAPTLASSTFSNPP
jgi:SAM-dependent methyltransferase